MLDLRSWFQLHDMLRIFTGVPKILKDILISERQRLRMQSDVFPLGNLVEF